jgi:hypothetical protein
MQTRHSPCPRRTRSRTEDAEGEIPHRLGMIWMTARVADISTAHHRGNAGLVWVACRPTSYDNGAQLAAHTSQNVLPRDVFSALAPSTEVNHPRMKQEFIFRGYLHVHPPTQQNREV